MWAKSEMVGRASTHGRPEARRECTWSRLLVPYSRTFHRKARITVRSDPPTHTVDTTVFELWLGSLSTHQGLSIPVV